MRLKLRFTVLVLALGPAFTAQAGPAGPPIFFDIAPQSLASAIDAYGATTDSQVLYNARLAEGVHSPGVRGQHDPVVALDLLLTGTGLRALGTGPAMFTLRQDASPPSLPTPAVNFRPYYAAIQASVTRALCRAGAATPSLRPGRYRLALRLWLLPSGQISNLAPLAKSGDIRRDEAVTEALRAIILPTPPGRLPQPVILVIQKRDAGDDCEK